MKTPLGLGLMTALSVCLLAAAAPAAAQSSPPPYRVTITNLTGSQIFSPPLAVSHQRTTAVFQPGAPPSPELAELAEDGNPGPLATLLEGSPGIGDVAVAGGPVMPGESVTLELSLAGFHNRLTVLGMLVTTNDAFFAVHGAERPFRRLPAVYTAVAYDAGSETNNESCDFIPGPPCGSGGVRAQTASEGYIHVHRGIQGIGDLEAADFDWRNPVAYVTVQRTR